MHLLSSAASDINQPMQGSAWIHTLDPRLLDPDQIGWRGQGMLLMQNQIYPKLSPPGPEMIFFSVCCYLSLLSSFLSSISSCRFTLFSPLPSLFFCPSSPILTFLKSQCLKRTALCSEVPSRLSSHLCDLARGREEWS